MKLNKDGEVVVGMTHTDECPLWGDYYAAN
jgi:hypothetical protein